MRVRSNLVRLRPQLDTLYVGRGFVVLAAGRDGFIDEGSEHGFFVHETRMLSAYHWLVDGEPLMPVALSNVEQHTSLGYYIHEAPGNGKGGGDDGSGMMTAASEYTLELRLHRTVGRVCARRST